MRAICHIGHHKTGTTSLQAFLAQNSHELLKAGTLYPWVENEGAANAVAKALRGRDDDDELSINIREAHNALAFRMLADTLPAWKVPGYHRMLPHSNQMMRAIELQIRELQPETTTLCSEVMSHFGKIAPDLITRLRTKALRSVSDISVWCTLRRPDEQLVSWHGQQLRFGQAPAPLSDPERGLKLDWLHVDYRGVIEPWAQLIPEAKLILRPYDEVKAEGGSIDDFFKHSKIKRPAKLQPAQHLNVGFQPAVIILLRKANKQLPKPVAAQLASHMTALTRGMELFGTSQVEFLGEASRKKLVEHFAPIHAWLSQVSGRKAFFADIDKMAQCNPRSEAEALQQFLDQLTPDRLQRLPSKELRDFLAQQHA
ncbi:MAG: hypothetical protein H6898_12625 [Rhodobacter sp.]|nr:hypothetical protein [Paracoccaceae bacterium]MCC0077400.1 hypothetical protein [Rhodobacter sp.]